MEYFLDCIDPQFSYGLKYTTDCTTIMLGECSLRMALNSTAQEQPGHTKSYFQSSGVCEYGMRGNH